MATRKDLLAEIEALKADNAALKNQSSVFFHRKPESDSAYSDLLEGKLPIFPKNKKACYEREGEPKITFIEGDNLPVLVALNQSHLEKVDVIYIDPPYNTGKDVYTYSDSYNTRLDKHSRWVSFMERRLELAKPLLRETGIVICAIGIEELSRLKLLMDNVFGEENFVSNVTWSGSFLNNARYVSNSSDYMLVYAKNIEAVKESTPRWRAKKQNADQLLKTAAEIWIAVGHDSQKATKNLRKYYNTDEAKEIFQVEPGLKMYNAIDNEGRLYRASDLSSPSGHGGTYEVINPHTGRPVSIPKRGWVHSRETLMSKIDSDQILWNGDGVPSFKRYLKDNLSVVMKDHFQKDRDFANKLLQKQIGRAKFSYPKDHNTLSEWIEYVIPEQRNLDVNDPPVILDFFAGSGSTAHAVAQLNSGDNGNRECILVTTNESGIASDVAIPRIKALLSGEWADKKDHPPLRGSLIAYSTEMLDESEAKSTRRNSLYPVTRIFSSEFKKKVTWMKDNHLLF